MRSSLPAPGFRALPSPAAAIVSAPGLGVVLLLRFLLLALLAGGGSSSLSAEEADTEIRYNRDVRPILSDKCFQCHGPDKNTREADMRLDIREEALAAKAFVPGDPEKSESIVRIFHEDPDEKMPPDEINKPLTPKEKEILKRWIAQGAEYEAHWAYLPVKRPEAPKPEDAGNWARNEIDQFILARLEENGLTPRQDAGRVTLIRRLSLDLTGLPPTPEEVEQFVNDTSDRAYERLVDRLLESPHYGERMAIPWLDAVRFADSVGYHGDQERDASPFRDYVIEAFNDNLPFDQFTIEQLAGDLLPEATLRQQVAASYNRLNQISAEGGIQDAEYLAKYQSERVRTTSTAWMGSTLACAECHDHKFDPFTTEDFYEFAAFFADILEKGAWNGDGAYQEDTGPYEKPGLIFERFGPELLVPGPEQQAELDRLRTQLTHARQALNETTPALTAGAEKYAAQLREELAAGGPRDFVYLRDRGDDREIGTKGWTFISPKDGPVYEGAAARKQAGKGTETIQHIADTKKQPLELSEGDVLFAYVYLDPKNPPKQVMLQFHRDSDQWSHRAWWGEDLIPFGKSEAETAHHARGALPKTGEWVRLEVSLAEVGLAPGDKLTSLAFTQAGGLAFWDHSGIRTANEKYRWADVPEPVLAVAKKPADQVTEAERLALLGHYRTLAPELQPVRAEVAQLEGRIAGIEAGLRRVPATISAAPREIRVLPRGNWMDKSGKVVAPAAPHFLPQLADAGVGAGEDGEAAKRPGRLELAQWMVSRENPLTSRTFVNRLWAQFFGTGISKALNDLGSQGEWPVHPELLDWLAAEFMDSGWDVKHLVRLIVHSSTYRQDSLSAPELEEKDPFNRLLARQSRVRLPAEVIRDHALAVSGLLNPAVGGPSVHPYQPAGYYQHLNFPRREYQPDLDENQYRRGLYTHWQRTFLHPAMMNFDAPSREECTMDRPTSNTPLQALVLLNDPSYVEAARALAERITREHGNAGVGPQIAEAFRTCLSREPQPEELRILTELHSAEHRRYSREQEDAKAIASAGMKPADDSLDPVEVAAMTAVTRALLNLHETITRY